MESSEDDAGAATSASCRASAREKDVGQAEDIDATCNFQHESSETRASCPTPAMSEDNFDNDSIPSPSTKDTSTEAILDMIDDFIDGPGARRRVPLELQAAVVSACDRGTESPVESASVSLDTQHNIESEKLLEPIAAPPCEPPAASGNSESVSESVHVQPAEAEVTPHSEIVICANTSTSEELPQASSSIQVIVNENPPQKVELSRSVVPEVLTEQPVTAPPSSSVETVQAVSDTSECENQERTVKCVTSSENRDSVTVELAESTSSECSVSESKTPSVEPSVSRSPLKRRLIRPAPSDRRPDSTVSSTADSQTTDIHTTDQTSSEIIAKDVSSSSDAVPNVHGSTKPEEIRNVSEISICKAETSTAPSRKIKLVRPKVTPVMSSSIRSETRMSIATLERDQCQSTSSDDISTLTSAESSVETSSIVTTAKSEEQESKLAPVCNDTTEKLQSAETSRAAEDVSKSRDIPIDTTVEEKPQNIDTPKAPEIVNNKSDEPSALNTAPALVDQPCAVTEDSPANILSEQVQKQIIESKSDGHIIDDEKKILPIKVNLSVTRSGSEINTNDLESKCSNTNLEHSEIRSKDDNSRPSTSLAQNQLPEVPSTNCDQESKQTEIVTSVSNCEDLKTVEKKVPPIKLNLTNADHSLQSKLPSNVHIEEESTSQNIEDSTKQVPKLTIKLTNKHTEEAKSPVSKLTPKPLRLPVQQNKSDYESNQQIPSVTKINIKPIVKPIEKENEIITKPLKPHAEENTDDCDSNQQIQSVAKINIKPIAKPTEKENETVSKTLQSSTDQNKDDQMSNQQIPSVTKLNIKPIVKPNEKGSEIVTKPSQLPAVQDANDCDTDQHIPSVSKINIKPILKPTENISKSLRSATEENKDDHDTTQKIPIVTKINIKPIVKPTDDSSDVSIKHFRQPAEQNADDSVTHQQMPIVTKINIKPILNPAEQESESMSQPLKPAVQNADDCDTTLQIPSVTKINIKPIVKPTDEASDSSVKPFRLPAEQNADENVTHQQMPIVTKINIKPIPKPAEQGSESMPQPFKPPAVQNAQDCDTTQQIPNVTKINIKPILKPTEKGNENVPKSLKLPVVENVGDCNTSQQIPSVTKINIKPILKPMEKINDAIPNLHSEPHQNDFTSRNEFPNITKLNIKPIIKPPEKINEIHRKSSSSEISESEYSENDESTSTSDQASASDQGPLDTVPKVTIKLGKPGTESEGKFYTEKNVPKLTIKNIQHSDKDDQDSKLKLIIGPSDDKQQEKIPKITIKNVTRSDSQPPLSPKLTIKPLKPPENVNKDSEIPKLKISTESFSSSEVKENLHVPKITIKPVTKTDADGTAKTPKKSTVMCDSSEHIPVVTKLNIKPILKPTESGESSESYDEKVPVVSKLNIKPVIKPKDSEVDSSIEDVPKFIKLNIKPLKNPEESSSEEKDCDEMNADKKDSSIPVVTKLNIKPIVKPVEDEALKDSENQSSETGSSDDNADHIPIVTKLNIKPIVKPNELEEPIKPVHNEQCIPVVTKLNIKPLIKPEDHSSPSSPKKESLKSPGSSGIPVVTKLNIKPIVKPEELQNKTQEENTEKSSKHPSLVMKINRKNVSESISENEHPYNNIAGKVHSPKMPNSPKATKRSVAVESTVELNLKQSSSRNIDSIKNIDSNPDSPSLLETDMPLPMENSCETNIVPENLHKTIINELHSSLKLGSSGEIVPEHSVPKPTVKSEPLNLVDKTNKKNAILISEGNETSRIAEHYNTKSSIQNCTLLKKLLSSSKEDFDKNQDTKTLNCSSQSEKSEPTLSNCHDTRVNDEGQSKLQRRFSPKPEKGNDLRHSSESSKMRSIQEVHREANESVTKPLEISITEKITNQSSGQDSPRIILKINKTDHGASAKIITEETQKPDCSPSKDSHPSELAVETFNDIQRPKKHFVYSRRKATTTDSPENLTMGKRLRSSRIVETTEKSPAVKRNVNKRPSGVETTSPPQHKESEVSILEAKRMKLEQLLSANKSLTITPVMSKTSPSKSSTAFNQGGKVSHNHTLLKNENCSQKNGNSKLHNILSNLQAKQMQSLQLNDSSASEKATELVTEVESNASTGSSDVVVEITRVENCHPKVQEMLINENSVCDLTGSEEVSQDPLEVEGAKTTPEEIKETAIIKTIEVTPTPRKRGRPRKLPLAESCTPPAPPPLPVPALEERPQRSLRLMRDRPAILKKPRGGRGRGRGGRRAVTPTPEPEPEPVVVVEVVEARAPSPIDPTSSRIKLPRMTEALDKSVAGASCTTPVSRRRRSSAAAAELKLFGSAAVLLESPTKPDEFMKSPESARPRSGRGSRGGRGRTPRTRGRGRGGGRGAMYMKETMGIYGRVCGPATTTVQLFEEETCMMDDNATPSKPSHLLDEDSQNSVKSSTNDSNKMKKSKFADLFDSNKVWTAADVKEYTWPTPDTPNAEPQVMMIQEQVAMFLGVKSFKRRYPELKRRAVGGEERDYVLSKDVVSEALCDLGITAVDASEVLDIMLSDYPHKYEEYRSHQRAKQNASSSEETVEAKTEEIKAKVEVKVEKSDKPEPPKVDPEKARQDMAAAAMASAAEWNARANARRRPACADLQSMAVQRRRAPAPPARPRVRVRPPLGFYPHALLPGQFQHWYRAYTPDQLRYFPLNTVLAAPPAPSSAAESSSESDGSWGGHSSSSDDSDVPHHNSAKRKKLSRVKRSSQQEREREREEARAPEAEPERCRACGLRLEANRKYTHERFLVCAHCNAKLHPGCVRLPPDTVRKCREYAWQCADCKSCCACRRPQDDDKMLFCDLCDRGFHIYCVGLPAVPGGRWHCVECAICKSCGARDPNGLTGAPGTPGPSTPGPSTPGISSGPGEWHHQTRRGPGGHKVYSHSLCTPCARAYRIGRYCPLCERSFIGPKGTMQLVICKLCDRQLHQECVRQTVARLRVLDYTCAECRRGGITSRAAAVRVAPRTIATLFMAKRRFNKYAHRQYMASRLQALQDASGDAADAPPDEDGSEPEGDPLAGVDPAPPAADDSAD